MGWVHKETVKVQIPVQETAVKEETYEKREEYYPQDDYVHPSSEEISEEVFNCDDQVREEMILNLKLALLKVTRDLRNNPSAVEIEVDGMHIKRCSLVKRMQELSSSINKLTRKKPKKMGNFIRLYKMEGL